MRYKVISFYSEPETNSNYYTEHSKRFISECKKYDIDYYVKELKGEGNYFKNCRLKPGFIQDCMNEFEMPLLWLDIDTYIKERPDMSNFSNIDFGAIKNNINKYPIFAHCLFFNNRQISLDLLKGWKNLCDKESGIHVGDHSLLCESLKGRNGNYKYISNFTKYTLAPTNEIQSKKSIVKKDEWLNFL